MSSGDVTAGNPTGTGDPTSAGDAAAGSEVDAAFAGQVAYCAANDATITGAVVAALARLLDDRAAGPFVARIRDWPGHALADGVPLRAAGALHGLHLSGAAPGLAPVYAGTTANVDMLVGAAVRDHAGWLLPWLDGPPQTNEAGRSAGFVAAMLWLAAQGLPARFACLEIGSSAGINLMLDRYRFALPGVSIGPAAPVMTIAPDWRGAPPPSPAIAFAGIKGCDVAPLDLTDAGDALRLKAFIWPEHTVRFARLEAAIGAAHRAPPDLVRMRAADFVEHELARPQEDATTRVVMHSIVWQYLPAAEQARIEAAMAKAGAAATPDRPLAWIALEADRTLMRHRLHVRFWPGGSEAVQLATAHAHGAWIDWGPSAPRRT